MNMQEFLDYLRQGNCVAGGSNLHGFMHRLAQEAMQVTAELNRCHEPGKIRRLFSELIGKPVPETVSIFPPFYSECGKNIFIGENVFINCCCHFQDHGGIYIGDGTLIGSYVVLATINHGQSPAKRSDHFPAPIHIGKNVWIGSPRYPFTRRNHRGSCGCCRRCGGYKRCPGKHSGGRRPGKKNQRN